MTAFTVSDLLKSHPPPVVNTVDVLRRIIHQAAPGVIEKVNRGWRSISFRDSQVGYFCGIFPFEDHVDLIFEFGSLLDDPKSILQGNAKQIHYLRFHEFNDVDADTVIYFLQAALNLPTSHSTRRDLSENNSDS